MAEGSIVRNRKMHFVNIDEERFGCLEYTVLGLETGSMVGVEE